MNKKNKWVFIAWSVKSVTVALTSVLVISDMPWTTITVLAIGAIVNEAIDFFDLKKK
jgi:hypothetical protein